MILSRVYCLIFYLPLWRDFFFLSSMGRGFSCCHSPALVPHMYLYYMEKAASNYLGTNESFTKRRQKVRRVLGNVGKKKLREHLIISSLAYPSQRECSAFASFSRALNLLHFMLMTFLPGTLNVPIKVRGLWPQFKK